jgi:hypothetical protein
MTLIDPLLVVLVSVRMLVPGLCSFSDAETALA